MLDVKMLTAQSVTFHIAPTGAKGEAEPAPAAEVAWATKDPALITLSASSDGLSCTAVSGATAGSTEVSCTVTNPDGTTATDTASVEIGPRDVTALNLSADSPVDV